MKKQLYLIAVIALLTFNLVACKSEKHIHTFEEDVIEATCTEEGYVKVSCECGYESERVITKLHHHYIDGKCICGAIEQLTISVMKEEESFSFEINYGNKIDITQYDFFQVEDEFFEGWSIEGELFDFNTAIYDDLLLTPKYYDTVTITFVNDNGDVLDTKKIIKGTSIEKTIIPTKKDFKFIGWDKSLSNITEDTVFTAKFEIIQKVYSINYVVDDSLLYYNSKEDMVNDFLTDFYEFVKPDISYRSFAYGIEGGPGVWANYIGGSQGHSNYLIYNNDIEANNDDYFFNSSLYKEKWYNLASYVRNQICGSNKRFGYTNVEYYYGALDFYRYIISDPAQYLDIYGGETVFYGFPQIKVDLRTSYEYLEENVNLYIPSNSNFDGWYKDEQFTDGPYTSIEVGYYGDVTFYAKTKTKAMYRISFDTASDIEVESIYVEKGEEVSLPFLEQEDCNFLGWYIDYEKVNDGFTYIYDCNIKLTAKWDRLRQIDDAYIVYDGKTITYRNTNIPVIIPDTYEEKEKELRACWVSSYVSNFSPSPNQDEMIEELTYILDRMEELNMNCLIFHLRANNDAFYQTELAPISGDYGTYETFEEWDYLKWLIKECHKRKIEFHAWLNPYRIELYALDVGVTPEELASWYANYPLNPASNPDNILITHYSDYSRGAILNPAKEEVQNYIVNVCLELVSKYKIDAIHFDDYFYQQLSNGSNILDEADQGDFIDYVYKNPDTFSIYSETDKENWRRMNIDNLIFKLHTALETFNNDNDRNVELGISPTAVYRSGDGSVESGSNTTSGGHYNKHLYCDTVKWINEGWIDYIMPQCYTSFDYKNLSFHDITSWWNKVVDQKECKLYIGLGLYQSYEWEYEYSWATQPNELLNQLYYLNTLENVKGVSLYSFNAIDLILNNRYLVAHTNLVILRDILWTNKTGFIY